MIPRKRLDLGWLDLAAGVAACFGSADAQGRARRVEGLWSQDGTALACLSVRSGFDALLTALALPAGSEVLMSAVTIRDMARIVEAHGLVPVPLDLDMRRLAVSEEGLARSCGPKTKALLVAHLFGSRMPMQGIVDAAHRRGLLVIEDCAQAYAGDGFRGHPASDVTMFSFGTIKTATALGGALLGFRDGELCRRVAQVQASWPRQSRVAYVRRCLKVACLMLLSARAVYGAFVAACRVVGIDHDRLVATSVRGFAGPELFSRLRRQPCAALLGLLARRLRDADPRIARTRAERGRMLGGLLRETTRPGEDAPDHTYWVYPIEHRDPDAMIRHLRSCGFDATRGASSMCVVAPPKGRDDARAIESLRTFERLLYLPFDGAMTPADCERLAAAVASFRGAAVDQLSRAFR